MLQVGGSVVVDVAGLRFPDLAGAPVRTADLAALLEDILEGVAELPPEPEQEHGHVAAQDRQLQLPQQVSQSAGRQAEALVEEGGGLRGGPAEPIVKQSRGFGPAARVRLETDRDPTHLGTRYHIRVEHQRGGTLVSGSVFSLVGRSETGGRKEEEKGRRWGDKRKQSRGRMRDGVPERGKVEYARVCVCARQPRSRRREEEEEKDGKEIDFRLSRVQLEEDVRARVC